MRRSIVFVLIFLHIVLVVGCTSSVNNTLLRDELAMWTGEKIVELTLDNGSIVVFNNDGGRLIRRQNGTEAKTTIVGTTNYDEVVQIDLNSVLGAKIERSEFNTGSTILLTLSLTVGVFFTLLIIAFSNMR